MAKVSEKIHVHCAFDKMIDINKLKPHPKNRNKHSAEQIARLAEIINYQGIRHPIKVSTRSGFITAGHGRLDAFRQLKIKKVPIDEQDYDTEEQEYADIQSDNAIALWAELDLSGINADLPELGPDFNLDMLGIKDFMLEPAEKVAMCDEDEVPENAETRAKLGDRWLLGDHVLVCGDSTDVCAVDLLMMGENADITFTSPPYNANKNAGGLIKKKYEKSDDAMDDSEYLDFLTAFTALAIEYSKFCFVNIQMLSHNRRPLFDWQNNFKDKIKDVLIWRKNIAPPQINKGTFNCKWEYVFCFSNDAKSRAFPCEWHGQHANIIETENASQNEYANIHRATFPVSFPEWIITKMDFCKTVFDPFGGSGSTLIACEKINRKCFMMEIDPHYCDVILARWEKYTGKTAELQARGDDGKTKD